MYYLNLHIHETSFINLILQEIAKKHHLRYAVILEKQAHLYNIQIRINSKQLTMKNFINIHFSAYAVTNFGDSVYITGNCPQLGLWEPKKGLLLQTNPRDYPIWSSKKSLTLQKLTDLEYKLCVVNREGETVRWENLKYNRALSLKTSCSILFTEGQTEVQLDFDIDDSVSTQYNSIKKTALSDIEQQSDDDEPDIFQELYSRDLTLSKQKRLGGSLNRYSSGNLLEQLYLQQQIKSQQSIRLQQQRVA